MLRDYRIQEISDSTELTKNYVYTCLKKMPGIFKNSVSTGQHNSKIFSQRALDLFKQISELKKERMWSIAQIRNYLKSSQSGNNVKNNQRLNNIETHSATFAYRDEKSCFKEGSNLSYNIPTQTLIEQIFALKEEIATLEKKNANLKSSLAAKEIETSAQRKMSDQIIFELTTHISKLSNSISDSADFSMIPRAENNFVDKKEINEIIEIPELTGPGLNDKFEKLKTRKDVFKRMKNELEISSSLISKTKENKSDNNERSACPDELANPVKRGDRS